MTTEASKRADAPPFVSVILPVLNGAGRLEHALRALRQQDYPEAFFEVIVADGGSTDATATIAAEFGCRVVDNPGITVAAGRNVGLAQARGELIAFSEDDIVLPPHWLSSAVRVLTESGAAGVGGPTPIPASSRVWSHAVNAVFRAATARGASVQSDRALTGVVSDLPGGNSLYTARALRAVGPIDESLTTAEDVAMHHQLRQSGFELRMCEQLAAEHHKRDSVSGFFRQIQRFAIGRVQLSRRWPGALSRIHWLVAGAAPLAASGVYAALNAFWSDPILIGLLVASLWLIGTLMAVRQGERPAVALLFPVAMSVFLVGWGAGFWSELLLPSRDAHRISLTAKIRDTLDEMAVDGTRALRCLAGGIIALNCSLLAIFSQRAPFVMDEFQQGGFARHIGTGYYSSIIPFKTVLFTYPYYLPRLWLQDAGSILLVQRALTVAIVLATFVVMYATSRKLGRTTLEALLVVATTSCFSTFFEQSGRLRAEPAALFLAMLALYVAVSACSCREPRWQHLGCGLALGGAFFCTQKAIWFCVAIGVSAIVGSALARLTRENPGVRPPRERASAAPWPLESPGPFRRNAATANQHLDFATDARALVRVALPPTVCLCGGFALVAMGYCVAFPPATPAQVFRGVFLRASRFAMVGNDVYGDLGKFIWQSLERNWWLYGICGLGFALGTTRVGRDPKLTTTWLATLFMSLFILTWKEPWPYTLTWWIPFLALFAPDASRVASYCIRRSTWSNRWRVLAGAVALTVGLTVPRKLEALSWDNQSQLDMVQHLEDLLAPDEYYQDGIGMVSTRGLSGLVWWDAPAIARISHAARRGDAAEVRDAFRDGPKIVVMNYRLQNLQPVLASLLDESYTPVDRGLLVAGTQLAASGRSAFEVRWAGRYALVDQQGRRSSQAWSVDGVEVRGAAWLTRGSHVIDAAACAGCGLIPDDVVGKVAPSTAATTADLFDRPYTR